MFKYLLLSLCLFCNFAIAANDWHDWLGELRKDALAEGIAQEVFDQMLRNWRPKPQVVKLDRSQPEKRIGFSTYRKTRANKSRINYGRRAWKKHGDLISKIGNQYQVDPCIIAAIWGIETSYGNYMGKFPVIESLATLAYDGRRAEFFRKELMIALHIINDGHVTPYKFVGEWAGGSGHPQFLPSSWVNYAQDYDQDGRKDIWGNLSDVFASIANYLHQNGWQFQQPWAAIVNVKAARLHDLLGFENSRYLDFWKTLGVRSIANKPLPKSDGKLALLQLDGGPLILAYPNFKVIMRYNHSVYYAGTVGYLADKICRRSGVFG